MTPEAIRRIIEHIPIRYDAGTPPTYKISAFYAIISITMKFIKYKSQKPVVQGMMKWECLQFPLEH